MNIKKNIKITKWHYEKEFSTHSTADGSTSSHSDADTHSDVYALCDTCDSDSVATNGFFKKAWGVVCFVLLFNMSVILWGCYQDLIWT